MEHYYMTTMKGGHCIELDKNIIKYRSHLNIISGVWDKQWKKWGK